MSREGVRASQPPQGVQTAAVVKAEKDHPVSASQGVSVASGSQGVAMGDIERTIASFNSLLVKTFGLAHGTAIMAASYAFATWFDKPARRTGAPVQVTAAAVVTLGAKLEGREIQQHHIRTLWRVIGAPYGYVDVKVEERRLFAIWALAPGPCAGARYD